MKSLQVLFDGQNPLADADKSAEYAAVWLQLEIRRLRHFPAFAAAIPSVISHAETFPGLVRFGFDIDWEQKRFRTFGAFDTELSLRAYVNDGAHGQAYRGLRGRLGEVHATYGAIAAARLPRTWDDIPDEYFTKGSAALHQSLR